MSNLHVNLDEANKHTPKGFDNAVNNTRPWKDEQSQSTYTENFQLPRAINFVDGTVAPPTTADLDVYVLTGAGSVDAGWGTATFGDWVRFLNGIAAPITPLAGALCYDDTAASWKEFDGSVWAVFGGSGSDTNLGTDNLTLSGAVTRTYNIDGNELKFIDGPNNKLKVTPSGVGIGNVGTPAAVLEVRGAGSTSGTTALLVENSSGDDLFKINDLGTATIENYLDFNNSGSLAAEFGYFGGGFMHYTAAGVPIDFRLDGVIATLKARFHANGNLNIGSSSADPGQKLRVQGDVRCSSGYFQIDQLPSAGKVASNDYLPIKDAFGTIRYIRLYD